MQRNILRGVLLHRTAKRFANFSPEGRHWGERVAGGRPADGSPLNSAGVGPMRVSSMSTLRSVRRYNSRAQFHWQSRPGQARPDQTLHTAATRLPVRSTGQQQHIGFCDLKLGSHLGRVNLPASTSGSCHCAHHLCPLARRSSTQYAAGCSC
jgi:hypothetical protein